MFLRSTLKKLSIANRSLHSSTSHFFPKKDFNYSERTSLNEQDLKMLDKQTKIILDEATQIQQMLCNTKGPIILRRIRVNALKSEMRGFSECLSTLRLDISENQTNQNDNLSKRELKK